MVCCALIAFLFGSVVVMVKTLTPLSIGNSMPPLDWTPDAPAGPSRPHRFSIAARVKSFGYAFAGLAVLVRQEHNAWLHLAATILAVLAGMWLQISLDDWRWIILAIALVWATEAINTAIERCCNVISQQHHEGIKAAKDLAAAAVLLSALAAFAIGVATFAPYVNITVNPLDICTHTSGINGGVQ